jgi:hypothetical protein
MSTITALLDREIGQLEERLSALRSARTALAGGVPGRRRRSAGRKPGQRTFTAAQRAEQARILRLYWQKKRREGGNG